MGKSLRFFGIIGSVWLASFGGHGQETATTSPAPITREFRGVWVTTVYNIDWPSRKGLPIDQQQAELVEILDQVASLKLNAVVFQVRSMCDAMYASKLEPWAECLTGQMGKPPEPFYDPLEFAVAEAHKRGLELHAWFNPFRARASDKATISPKHISQTHPELVRRYGTYLWMDPAEKAAQDHTLKVIRDVVRRYNVDGVQIDDYFYPPAARDSGGKIVSFPDPDAWQRYISSGGKLNRDDWRRQNINDFVERLYKTIKKEKDWVKFGISPPGIWRPGHPSQIKGRDVYADIYADSRLWLANGWCDYFSPQLYWSIDKPEQSFPVLLQWWSEQNAKGRHLWPGLSTGNLTAKDWPAEEILRQIETTRQPSKVTGHLHYHMRPLRKNSKGIADSLAKTYGAPALVPASPWLSTKVPSTPTLRSKSQKNGALVSWFGSGKTTWWVLQCRSGDNWTSEILSDATRSRTFTGESVPEEIAITAINRYGTASAPAVRKIKSGAK